MKIKFTGTEDNILEIINALPGKAKAIKACGKSITIPTSKGAKQVFVGDVVVVEGENVRVEVTGMKSLKITEVDKRFHVGQDCPFCDGKLVEVEGKLQCYHEDCYFNKVEWR
ncbi:MAG: hypothetical protein WC365_00830 [Candidatus Babeliales bacterium]|jgi:ASC-1-like (ASCH) protein